MNGLYQVARRNNKRKVRKILADQPEALRSLMSLTRNAGMAVREIFEIAGCAAVEAVLDISAQEIAGPRQQGRARSSPICWFGRQPGSVSLGERRLQIERPRLRKKGVGKDGEVEVPAYEAMSREEMGGRLLEIVLRGVSTRNYRSVLSDMAETVGVSRSTVSREAVEAMDEELRRLCERRFDGVELLAIYVDGVRQGEHVLVVALGVDGEGNKHVLGLREGATENATVVKGLLEDLVERGIKPNRRRLWVVDGSKALYQAIQEVYGSENPVQRCRVHKVRNVTEHLPEEERAYVRSVMKAAYRLDAEEGMGRLRKLAERLEKEHPSAAASLREGLEETFTVNRLGLTGSLRRCLCTTNVIENPNSGLRRRTGRVSRWRDGQMALRWTASSLLAAEKHFRKIMGHEDLWMLEAVLKGESIDKKERVA